MKVYLFDSKTGVYEGESFEEPDMLQHEDGLTAISPPDYGHGQVPVFDRQKRTWTAGSPAAVQQQSVAIKGESSNECL